MTVSNRAGSTAAGSGAAGPAAAGSVAAGRARSVAARLDARDIDGLTLVGDMYGLQLDQVTVALALPQPRARTVVARWRRLGYADAGRLGPGTAWIWLNRAGLTACGLGYRPTPPALSRLAHIRAVTEVRFAIEATTAYRAAGAFWRGERRLRAASGGRVGLRHHLPDAEVHWPDGAPVPWAGECWAVEAELTRKTVRRTAAIMTELLLRTGDYGCAAADAAVAGRPARHARALYLCSAAARPVVLRARDSIGPLGTRVEIRDLPARAPLDHADPDPAAADPVAADPAPA